MENELAMRAEQYRKKAAEEREKAHRMAIYEILKKVDEIRQLERGLESLKGAGVARAEEYEQIWKRVEENKEVAHSLIVSSLTVCASLGFAFFFNGCGHIEWCVCGF